MSLSSRDPILVARAAKQLVRSGHWQQQIAADTRVKVLMSLKSRMPWAVGHLPVDGLVALTKQPPPGGCHWCAAAIVRDLDKPELERNEVTLALLGKPCADCRGRWEAAAITERERAHTAALVAAGFKPEAAANLRTPQQMADYTRRLRALDAAKPTGAIWPARQPVPSYYRRGRP